MPSPSLPFAMPSYGAYDGSHGHVISLTLYQTTDQDYRLIFANRFRHASLSMCCLFRQGAMNLWWSVSPFSA